MIANTWINMPVTVLGIALLIALQCNRKRYPINMYVLPLILQLPVLTVLELQGGVLVLLFYFVGGHIIIRCLVMKLWLGSTALFGNMF